MRRLLANRAATALLAAFLASGGPIVSGPARWGSVRLHAQVPDTAALVGRVLDASGLTVPNATVVVTSPALLGGPRTVVSDARGEYRVGGIAPGDYEVRASRDGFAIVIRRGIELHADATLTLDLHLALAGVEQQVTVDEAAAPIDVTTAAKPLRIDRTLLQNLPSSRVLSDVLNLAPGVNGGIAMGGVQQSNGLYVEGVNTADLVSGGPWVPFNYNWIDEVQVVALGAGAQEGDFSGVVQKARLRSGSDRFSGFGELVTTRPEWVGSNTQSLSARLQRTFTSERIQTWHDADVNAGGPLRRGRLWAFGGIQLNHQASQPALYSGPDAIDSTDRRVIARLDAAATPSLRLGGFYEYDRNRVTGDGLGPMSPIETTTTDTQPNHNWQATAKWLAGSTAIELSTVGAGGTLTWDPAAPGARSGPSPHVDTTTSVTSVTAPFYQDLSTTRRSVNGAATRSQPLGGQLHLLSGGAQFEWASQHNAYGYPGGRTYLDVAGVPSEVYIWPGFDYTSGLHRFTAYLQDRWALGAITVEPGVRFTINQGVQSQGTVMTTRPVSPRLGVAWDIGGAHTTVASVHVGRYHAALLAPNFAFARADQVPDEIHAQVIAPDQFVEISRSVSSSHASADPGITQPFFDQFVGSLEHAVRPTLTLTGQAIVRHYRNFMGMVDVGSVFQPVAVVDPGPDGIRGNADDGGPLTAYAKTNPGHERYVYTNPGGLYRDYTAAQLIARYRVQTSFEAIGSYTWSRSYGNVENALRSNTSGPELWTNGVAADPNRAINNTGANTFDFTHEVKLLGTWHLPYSGGWVVSGIYRYHTGEAWGRSAHFTNQLNTFVTFGVRVEPRDARRTPSLSTVDARLEKEIPLGAGRKLGLLVDGFNLTNQGIPDPERRRAIWEVSGPSFGVPTAWLSPRSARAAVRVTF